MSVTYPLISRTIKPDGLTIDIHVADWSGELLTLFDGHIALRSLLQLPDDDIYIYKLKSEPTGPYIVKVSITFFEHTPDQKDQMEAWGFLKFKHLPISSRNLIRGFVL